MSGDSIVRCDKCSRELSVDFAWSLREGWPMCHGQTMRLLTTKADIAAAVGSVFARAQLSVEGPPAGSPPPVRVAARQSAARSRRRGP